jgi:hypothetical protein
MNHRSTPARLLALAASGLLACAPVARPALPPPTLPGDVPVDVRVRVIAAGLPPGWHPGHLVKSPEGCRVVVVATTPESKPIVLLNMGEIAELQLSRAEPPPDWWTEPRDEEGWTEFGLGQLRDESALCRSRYPATGPS